MGWLAIITAILPLIMKIIEIFQGMDPNKLTAKQKAKFGQLKTACQQFDSVTSEKGLSAVPLPVAESEE